MFTKFVSHFRRQYAGFLALFIVLGGTSYAVATGSIDSREIKNSTIRGKDIRNNQVSTSDVKNGSLLSRDFKPGQLPAGPQGPRGAAGPQGPRGALGPQGEDAPLPTRTVVETQEAGGSATATCPAGFVAVGGGGNTGSLTAGLKLSTPQGPDEAPTAWHVQSTNLAQLVTAYAVCESP